MHGRRVYLKKEKKIITVQQQKSQYILENMGDGTFSTCINLDNIAKLPKERSNPWQNWWKMW